MRAAIDYLRLCWRLWRDPRVPPLIKLIPFAAALYVVSPIDILPDWYIPGIGYLDDGGVVLLALRTFVRLTPPRVRLDHQYWLEHRGRQDWDVEAEAVATDADDDRTGGEAQWPKPIR